MLKVSKFNQVTRIDSARTISGRGSYWTTAYLVDGLLVDSGCAHAAHELVAALADETLTRIVNTHSHEDHIGANSSLQAQRDGLEIFAHPFALPILRDPRGTQPLQFYRRVMWGRPEPSEAILLEDGQQIETEHHTFQVIYTPGHSADHICLYEPQQGWLFTGDLYVGGKDRALRIDYDIWQIIDSLKRVADLPLSLLFPGSARVRENPNQALASKIAYLEDMGEKVLDLHTQGKHPKEIARTLFGPAMFIESFTFGHFSRLGLVNSYLAKKHN